MVYIKSFRGKVLVPRSFIQAFLTTVTSHRFTVEVDVLIEDSFELAEGWD